MFLRKCVCAIWRFTGGRKPRILKSETGIDWMLKIGTLEPLLSNLYTKFKYFRSKLQFGILDHIVTNNI